MMGIEFVDTVITKSKQKTSVEHRVKRVIGKCPHMADDLKPVTSLGIWSPLLTAKTLHLP